MPKYLLPKATCLETRQTVASNDLVKKFMINQQRDAQLEADRLAANMTTKTGRTWSGYVETFTVDAAGLKRL
jgi:predicted Zn-dependent protease